MSKKILVADDSRTIQRAVIIALNEEDVELVRTRKAAEVLDAVRTHTPDAILLDNQFHQYDAPDGYALCETIKKDPALAHIPVAFLASQSYDEGKGSAAGASLFVSKPFDSKSLIECVQQLIELSDAAPAPVLADAPVIPSDEPSSAVSSADLFAPEPPAVEEKVEPIPSFMEMPPPPRDILSQPVPTETMAMPTFRPVDLGNMLPPSDDKSEPEVVSTAQLLPDELPAPPIAPLFSETPLDTNPEEEDLSATVEPTKVPEPPMAPSDLFAEPSFPAPPVEPSFPTPPAEPSDFGVVTPPPLTPPPLSSSPLTPPPIPAKEEAVEMPPPPSFLTPAPPVEEEIILSDSVEVEEVVVEEVVVVEDVVEEQPAFVAEPPKEVRREPLIIPAPSDEPREFPVKNLLAPQMDSEEEIELEPPVFIEQEEPTLQPLEDDDEPQTIIEYVPSAAIEDVPVQPKEESVLNGQPTQLAALATSAGLKVPDFALHPEEDYLARALEGSRSNTLRSVSSAQLSGVASESVDALRQISGETIEKIAWEVVPELAEIIIREMIERQNR